MAHHVIVYDQQCKAIVEKLSEETHRAEAAEAEHDELKEERMEQEEEFAAVLPEDWGPVEYIKHLEASLKKLKAENDCLTDAPEEGNKP